MLNFFLTALHIVVALILILVVLLQTGKRADLAGAFGGGGSQTAFGTRGVATLLSKVTTAAAVLFMITSISLSLVATRQSATSGGTVLEEVEATTPATEPEPAAAEPTESPAAAEESGPSEDEPAEDEPPADDSQP